MDNTLKNIFVSSGLSIVSGFLLYLSWPVNSFAPLLFISLVPLFFALERVITNKWSGVHAFVLFFLAHFVWSMGSMRWLHLSSPKTYWIAIFVDAFVFALCLFPFSFVRKRIGGNVAMWFLVFAWITNELINQSWVLGAPYLALGNGFGMYPSLIQFYEFLGVEGGSLLILIVNVGIYFTLRDALVKKSSKKWLLVLVGILPFAISPLIRSSIEGNKQKIAVLHSSRETYKEEYHQHPERIIHELWGLSSSGLKNSELMVWPETIVSNLGWLTNVSGDKAYSTLMDTLRAYPSLTLCTGGFGFSVNPDGANDPYSVFVKDRKFYYQAHNIALSINGNGLYEVRSKDIFIPFQERIPFLGTFPFMKDFADVVGSNTMISFYPKSEDVHKTVSGDSYTPVLCYESIFPLRMASHSKESEFIVVLANEFWNKDMDGSNQYLMANVAMCIQSKTWMVRSSNHGISAFIDDCGNLIQSRKGSDEGLLTGEVVLKSEETVYELIAGYCYYLSVAGSILILLRALIGKRDK
ncbi:MAG: apolipoprotein N-acyltransferase [Bacteroidetes bacterium]|nr:MAG: apolipoprotein N-acyltransferase [Bacteroidota bacterium]